MSTQATIFGLGGPVLSSAEKVFFRDAKPWAFILFARNIETPIQVKVLTQSLRDAVGRNCLIFVDQEGGRVRRLRPPHWPNYHALGDIAARFQSDRVTQRRLIYLQHRLIAEDLKRVGINANCAPVLDIPVKGADPIISDRAMGPEPRQVTDLGHAAMAGLMKGAVVPVIKHIPGHGRATVDSHKALPRIATKLITLKKTDFLPFEVLRHAPMAMTAHAIYTDIDPYNAATVSPEVVDVIRADIGFDGLLMTDDLNMKALSGGLTKNTEKALSAGCDVVLQCSGELPDMVNVAKGSKSLTGAAAARASIAEYCAQDVSDFDYEYARAELDQFMSRLELAA